MCGISGFINHSNQVISGQEFIMMNHAIKHRGPDDEGYTVIVDKHVTLCYGPDTKHQTDLVSIGTQDNIQIGLGFRRLSILDLTHAGHQPMCTTDHTLTITFNGEIYNYQSIRKELIKFGYTFISESDTEVILIGFKHWGKAVFAKLDGMFAVVIYDQLKQEVVFARDRMGIKPIYFYEHAGLLVWCSEIKGILKLPTVKRKINWEGVLANFYLQTTPSPFTCFEHIRPFPAGHIGTYQIESKQYKEERFYQLPQPNTLSKSKADAEDEITSLLNDAVVAQLHADVPVTTFLSGGIDSTLITALAKTHQPNIHAYTLGIDASGNGNDEIPQAKAMADKLGIQHHIHIIKPEAIINDLDATLRHYEDPYNDIEVLNNACQYVHEQGYKVVLNGNGADELFGGYPYILQIPKWNKLRHFSSLTQLIPFDSDLFKKVKNKLHANDALGFYATNKATMRIDQLTDLWPNQDLNKVRKQISQSKSSDMLQAIFENDMILSIQNHHVIRDDISAMRHSVELRYPYLSNELIDYVAALPLSLRYNFSETKPLLRNIAAKYIHTDNLNMKKKGFSLPMGTWMQENSAFKEYINTHLDNLKKRNIFNNTTIDIWLSTAHKPYDYHKIWQLLSFEIWLQTYID